MEFELKLYKHLPNALGLHVFGHSHPEYVKTHITELLTEMCQNWSTGMQLMFQFYAGNESVMEFVVDTSAECFILFKGFPFNFSPVMVDLCAPGVERFLLKYYDDEHSCAAY